jgi:hypothetical protein
MTIDETHHLAVEKVVEHDDGGATYTFEMSHKTTQSMAEIGLELILICAAYGVDIQDAFDSIRSLGEVKE